MKYRIPVKLILCYLIGSVFMFAIVNTFGLAHLKRRLIEEEKSRLYQITTSMIREYVNPYYQSPMDSSDRSEMNDSLISIDSLLNARIWVIDSQGIIITDTRRSLGGMDVNHLDEGFVENTFLENAYFQGVFSEPMLCVIQNATFRYTNRGYICVIVPMQAVLNKSIYIMDVFNLCILLLLLALFLIFIMIYLFTVLPANRIIKAAKEYSKGNYDAPMHIRSHDEYQELAGTIAYLVRELRTKEDYQKKFIANISHDFRSPLTSIRGYAEAMKDGTIQADMQEKYFDIILFETERLNKLTSNLLTLNSFEQNGAMLDIRSFDINEAIKKTVAAFEGICIKKRIMCKLQFFDKEAYVEGDLGKIQQVLHNLVDNAIKFSSQDTSIRIHTEEKGNKVYISVRDFGIGIPKESIHKIWERFYKSDISRGKDKKGTGLGLSIVKDIIAAHKENINVISTEGVGTEFVFTLPKSGTNWME